MPNPSMTEPFEFVSQMQHAALEIDDHQVVRRRMSQSLSDLIFEGFVPPFKMSNMVRSRHGSLRIHASDFSKDRRAGALRELEETFRKLTPKASAHLAPRRNRSPSSDKFLQCWVGSKMEIAEESLTWIKPLYCLFSSLRARGYKDFFIAVIVFAAYVISATIQGVRAMRAMRAMVKAPGVQLRSRATGYRPIKRTFCLLVRRRRRILYRQNRSL